MARKLYWKNALDGNLLDAVREAQKAVKESQSPAASVYERTRYAVRLERLEAGMQEVARRGLLGAL